jgi:hypothetical protein
MTHHDKPDDRRDAAGKSRHPPKKQPGGLSSGLQPGGTAPGGGPGASAGSIGTGGAPTGGAPSGSVKRNGS